MEVTTQLDDNRAEKLAYIQQHTNQDLSEILNQTIDLYYEVNSWKCCKKTT